MLMVKAAAANRCLRVFNWYPPKKCGAALRRNQPKIWWEWGSASRLAATQRERVPDHIGPRGSTT